MPVPPRPRGEDGDGPDAAPEPAEAEPPPGDEPAEVNDEGDDPGLLDQVADAVGDLWDDPPNGEST